MYRVLYRKYRPRFFADVIGQPHVTETLKNEIKSDRLAHAYLFTGSRGTGKTTCSKILSKAVNCLNPQGGDPCGECEICRGIDEGTVLDVVEIDAASNNGVDDIRILKEEAAFTPAAAKFRVYIIDEVHMLSIGAFNALLKTLEEPPPHVLFILATTEVHKLPTTILSRCQRFDFHRIATSDIALRLKTVCENEKAQIDDNAALLIAGIADGAMRDALSLLDQCMGKGEHITEDLVRATAGLADKSHLFSMTEAFRNKDSAAAIVLIDQLYSDSKDMARLCEELIEHYRELMLIKTIKKPRDILVMSDEDFNRATDQAMAISLSDVVRTIDILNEAHEKMLRSSNRRIEMEMTAVRLCSDEAGQKIDPELANRVARIEKALIDLRDLPREMSARPVSSSPVPPPVAKPDFELMEQLRKNAVPMPQWPEVVEEIKKHSQTVGTSFDGSTAYISGKYVLVDSTNNICFDMLRSNDRLRTQVRDAVKMVTGQNYLLGRYSYPDERKAEDDPLSKFVKELKTAGIPVEDNKKKNNS